MKQNEGKMKKVYRFLHDYLIRQMLKKLEDKF